MAPELKVSLDTVYAGVFTPVQIFHVFLGGMQKSPLCVCVTQPTATPWRGSNHNIPMIRAAMAAATDEVLVFGSVWSPPQWMKWMNNDYAISRLKSEYFQTYADYYCKLGQFIKENLGPTMKTCVDKPIKVLAADDQRLTIPLWFTGFGDIDPELMNYIDGVGMHGYLDSYVPGDIIAANLKNYPDNESGINLGSWRKGEEYIVAILDNLVNHYVAWVDWNMAVDLQGGPNWAQNFGDSEIVVNSTSDEFYKQPMYYVLGHFSNEEDPQQTALIIGSRQITVDLEAKSIYIEGSELDQVNKPSGFHQFVKGHRSGAPMTHGWVKIPKTSWEVCKKRKFHFVLHPKKTYQKIQGFGGAVSDAAGINWKSLPPKLRKSLIDSYYGIRGLEYNMARVPIGGSDFSTHPYAYNESPVNDTHLTNFTLAPEDFQFLQTYKSEGVPIWGITTTNEPINGVLNLAPFNTLGWTPGEMGEWIVNNLGPTIRNSEFKDLNILTCDDQRVTIPLWFNITELQCITTPTSSYPWESPKVLLGSWDRAKTYVTDIIKDLNHNIVGWIDWNLCLDSRGGPNWAKNFVDSPIIVFADKQEFYKQPMYYALGHITKFVPKQSYRIAVETSKTSVKSVAFVTPRNTTVIVMYNDDDKTTVNIKCGERALQLTLAERSIVTLEISVQFSFVEAFVLNISMI
ncbi:unnamed protein product [Leptidea sinapis]|uniref:Glucosylceramidase n=1 Tax=Leptidea sinapis TaxID=189913 RepID=A0A5E4PZH1_9NEOP|nr:unnamed protein product [Leptidea sinapis]